MPNTRADTGDDTNLSQITIKDLRKVIREEMREELKDMKNDIKSLKTRVDGVDGEIKALKTRADDWDNSLDFASQRIDDVYASSIPAINAHISSIATALTQRLLDIDVHRRKWSLTVQGLAGDANEAEGTTRDKCVELAKNKLRIPDASVHDYAACHRLSSAAGSGIIMRFKDLDQRNRWINGARHLKDDPANLKISISPDLPPALRPMKADLLKKRKELPAEQKAGSGLRYLRSWPYVELRVQNRDPIRPDAGLSNIVESVLGVPINLRCDEPQH